MPSARSSIKIKAIENRIISIRSQRVMIDSDLADLYGVTTKRLNEQVKRNIHRFPTDFMFRLTLSEKSEVVANCDHLAILKFSKTLPYAFTEHGAIMAANVLNSSQAVEMSVFIVRTFIKLRQVISSHKELSKKVDQLEMRVGNHDLTIREIILHIRELINQKDVAPVRKIGFERSEKK